MSTIQFLGKSLNPALGGNANDLLYQCKEVYSHKFIIPEEDGRRTEEQRLQIVALEEGRCPSCAEGSSEG